MTNNPQEEYYEKLSIPLLKGLHAGASKAYANDKSMTEEQKQHAMNFSSSLSYYGTDVESDWPIHVDAMEAVMTRKNIQFSPIQK